MDNRTWASPTNFSETKFGVMGKGRRPNYGAMDYGAFMGLDRGGTATALRGLGQRRGAIRAAGMLGGIGRASQPLSSQFFGVAGKSWGRATLTGGLGMLAVSNAGNMMDRMRYGDYGGAMMSGAMTAAAGYGAYSSWMYKGALRSHFNNAAAWLLKRFR